MLVATLVALEHLSAGEVTAASDVLRQAGARLGPAHWWAPEKALDLQFDDLDCATARSGLEAVVGKVDIVVQPLNLRRRKLLVADMDSTMITVECIDELADYAGIKAQVAQVTEAAMRGELDFEAALDARVRLLKGLDVGVIARALKERVQLMPGAVPLIRTLARDGVHSVLVSGGFTAFAGPVAAQIGFSEFLANDLEIEGEQLAGTVARPVVTAEVKCTTLENRAQKHGIDLAHTIAIGDGANDIPMIVRAGLGVAYHAKPKTFAAADAAIRFGDLSVLLYAMGYAPDQWAHS